MSRIYPDWFIEDLVSEEDKERAISGDLKTTDFCDFKCSVHGSYNIMVGHHIKLSTQTLERGCSKCSRELASARANNAQWGSRSYPDWFIEELLYEKDKDRARNGSLTSVERVWFKCPKTGFEYSTSVSNKIYLKTGKKRTGCPCCRHVPPCRSSFEDEMQEFLDEFDVTYQKHARWIVKSPGGHWMEIDFYLPDFKFAIECDGDYYHREEYETFEEYTKYADKVVGAKWKGYNQWKTDKCLEKGIELYHVLYSDWKINKDLYKDYIRRKLTNGEINS